MKLSRLSYFADWVLIPILGCAALVSDVSSHGVTAAMVLAVAVGALLWTFVEYGTHRFVLHRMLRRDHWPHHMRPTADSMPGWQPSLVALLVAGGAIGSFGMEWGAALFTGFAAGYLSYSAAHYAFHHTNVGNAYPGNYWDRAARRHKLHHTTGAEINFGVVTAIWDIRFGTYRPA